MDGAAAAGGVFGGGGEWSWFWCGVEHCGWVRFVFPAEVSWWCWRDLLSGAGWALGYDSMGFRDYSDLS